jgi:DNA-binding CsgD family transcriptional regulator
LFDAIRDAVPVVAGILGVVRPNAPDRLVTHPVKLPPEVFESWLSTPREVLARTLVPVIRSPDGSLWRDADTITGPLRERLAVLHKLDGAGLGEGAGYKILKRPVPWRGTEHFMLALIAERGEALPPGAEATLAALAPAIREAVLRLQVPLVARAPLLGQIVEEQSIGYVCLSRGDTILEANRLAHQLVLRYGPAAGVAGRRRLLANFARKARDRAANGRTWHVPIARPPAVLAVNAHRLAREAHGLGEDITLVVLREIHAPPIAAAEPPALGELTARQREIALLITESGLSRKQIADRIGLSLATVNKHVENIHRALGVHSRAEMAMLLRGRA